MLVTMATTSAAAVESILIKPDSFQSACFVSCHAGNIAKQMFVSAPVHQYHCGGTSTDQQAPARPPLTTLEAETGRERGCCLATGGSGVSRWS